MMINFGEHEPMVEKVQVEREVVECKCGEQLFVDEKYPITDRNDHTNERTIRCGKCGRVYAPISDFRSGWDSCYILLGFPCQWCDGFDKKLYKFRRDDPEPFVCRKCVDKELVDIPKKIEEKETILAFLKEQVKEGPPGEEEL